MTYTQLPLWLEDRELAKRGWALVQRIEAYAQTHPEFLEEMQRANADLDYLETRLARYETALKQIQEHGGDTCDHWDRFATRKDCLCVHVSDCSHWTWCVATIALSEPSPTLDEYTAAYHFPPGSQAWWERPPTPRQCETAGQGG